MVTVDLQLILGLLETPTTQFIQAVLGDTRTVFWVDAREPVEAILEACESRLRTETLSCGEAETEAGRELYFIYDQKQLRVPLTGGPEDRHMAILSLNRILDPDYEIRFFTPSGEMESLAFVALPIDTWAQLDYQYGAFVQKMFYRISLEPNLFTDHLAVMNLKQF